MPYFSCPSTPQKRVRAALCRMNRILSDALQVRAVSYVRAFIGACVANPVCGYGKYSRQIVVFDDPLTLKRPL